MHRALLGALGVGLLIAGGAILNTAPAPGPSLSPVGAALAQDVDTSMVQEMALGAEDAPLTVVEYASFTCPHCKTFHENVFKDLKANYIDTGKVRFIYREVYFDRYGLWAAMVARCGGEARYFGITDLIYQQQADWTQGSSPAEVADNLRKIGRQAGMSNEELDACLQDGDKAQAMVALYQENVTKDGIDGTPSFIIDGQKYSNMDYDGFAEILDGKLGE